MPLSHKRDKDRKRLARLVQPNSNLNTVQPNKAKIEELKAFLASYHKNNIFEIDVNNPEDNQWHKLPINSEPVFRIICDDIDADGNPIPEY